MDLDELAPVGGRAPGRRDGWWLERFAQVREDPSNRTRFRDERDQPDVAAAGWALERKLLPHPGQEFRPRNPGGVMRAGLLILVAAASGTVTVVSMPAGRGRAPRANVADRQACRAIAWARRSPTAARAPVESRDRQDARPSLAMWRPLQDGHTPRPLQVAGGSKRVYPGDRHWFHSWGQVNGPRRSADGCRSAIGRPILGFVDSPPKSADWPLSRLG
jgi:hypothetical protein